MLAKESGFSNYKVMKDDLGLFSIFIFKVKLLELLASITKCLELTFGFLVKFKNIIKFNEQIFYFYVREFKFKREQTEINNFNNLRPNQQILTRQ